jgi:hypothetical protein
MTNRTSENILPEAFKADPSLLQQQEAIKLLRDFLDQCFPLPGARLDSDEYPSLPLFLSLLDTAIDRKEPFGPDWPPEKVGKVREAVEAAGLRCARFSQASTGNQFIFGSASTCLSWIPAVSDRNFPQLRHDP